MCEALELNWHVEELLLTNPVTDIVLVGTGRVGLFPPPAFKKYLNGLGIQVDVLDSVSNREYVCGQVVSLTLLPIVEERLIDIQPAGRGGTSRRSGAVPDLRALGTDRIHPEVDLRRATDII